MGVFVQPSLIVSPDPSGNRNEAFANRDIPDEDFPTITWTEDKIGQGIFYHRRELMESLKMAMI